MPKISTYNTVTPQGTDKIIISQENGTPTDVTKNITVDGLKEYINTEPTPTPNIYVLKLLTEPLISRYKVCIQKPIETDWLNKNPRLFMFRYKKAKTGLKKKGFIHPSHQNGAYQLTNFPGSNWGTSPLFTLNSNLLPPIDTEWDINTELQIAITGTIITDFALLRPATYIEIPFSKLQFLYNEADTDLPYTSLPATGAGTFCAIRGDRRYDTRTPWDSNLYNKLILKFAIGIPNPAWTNTNHELPYIMGNLSNAINIVYQRSNPIPDVTRVVITHGSNGTVRRVN
jgi:hypothetical protein